MQPRSLLPEPTALEFDSTEIDAAEDFLVRAYTKLRIGSSSEYFHARVSRAVVGAVSLDRLDIGIDVRYDVNPLGRICLCTIQAGAIIDQASDGWVDDFGPGDVVSLAPPNRPYSGRIRNSQYTITMFDPALLSKVAADPAGPAGPVTRPRPVRLRGHRPVSTAAAQQLRRTIDYLGLGVAKTPGIATTPLLVSTASQMLAASVLAAFDNTACAETTEDQRDSHSATLHRAIAFIDSHPDTEIGPADIAAAAGVTVRAIQLAFRRHLGTTPMAYLRQVRLAEAHKDLRAANPETQSVIRVAARWGFHHPGRFATLYRMAYGRSPSETLHS